MTPLHKAIKHLRLQCVETLLWHDADLTVEDSERKRPVDAAIAAASLVSVDDARSCRALARIITALFAAGGEVSRREKLMSFNAKVDANCFDRGKVLGRGSYGTVYHALWRLPVSYVCLCLCNGQTTDFSQYTRYSVALKIAGCSGTNPIWGVYREAIEGEVNALKALRHDHLIRLRFVLRLLETPSLQVIWRVMAARILTAALTLR